MKKFVVTDYPLAVQTNYFLMEWARPQLLKRDYVLMRNKFRRNPYMSREEVKAEIETGKRAYEESQRPKWKSDG